MDKNLNRRDILKALGLSTVSLPLATLSSCLNARKVQGFDVYWLHWEGAPLRLAFDHWIDPYGQHKGIKNISPTSEYKRLGQKISLPDLWFKNNSASPVLNNVLSIRGLSTKSPHLKQCRHEWFSEKLLQSINAVEEKVGGSTPFFSWSTSEERLSNIYGPIFGERRLTSSNNKNLFTSWMKEEKDKESSHIRLTLANGFGDNLYFEDVTQFDESMFSKLKNYYRNVISELETFVDYLQKRDLYKKSVILISSDRARVPTNTKFPLNTESLWQGLNLTLLSGAITGPVVLGHISKEHPKYRESYPGTWGHGISSWTPQHVHQLLADLCWSKRYTSAKSWVSDNPWMDVKPFNGLYIKQGPGQII